MIKAPFNFVPLADKVFFPDWADKVSQDLPFSDGLDGYLTVEFTAETPVFVRNGHSKAEGESKTGDYASAAITPDGRYYLPASSVKGMVRNILEILSYGKMNVDEKAMFAQREWDNPTLYTIKNINEQKRLRCGWLVRRDGKYYIRRCAGTPYRINHLRLDECLNTNLFLSYFSKNKTKIDLNKDQAIGDKKYDPKTAVYKYRLLEQLGIDRSMLKGFRFSEDVEYAVEFQERRVMMDPSGDFSGTIVLTGQPDLAKWPINGYQRKMGDGKFYEFVFSNEIEGETPLTQEEFDHFKFIYQDSPDWEYGKELLDGDGIPVFFRMRGDSIRDFGLAFLYKLPYEKSPAELEKAGNRYKEHSRNDCDLADCIFGYARGQQALKGRVQFSHFFSTNAEPDKDYTLVLNGPKASYYPIYIQQEGKNGTVTSYKTYNDGRLSGWKRYHVRNLVWEKKTGDPDLDTTIYPVKENSTFCGRVYFHNLRPEELGALVSAITFHGDVEHCFHQIGQAKPYGFGKLSVKIDTNRCVIENPCKEYSAYGLDYYLALFEDMMCQNVNSWYCAESITQLFTIARQPVTNDDITQYMILKLKADEEGEAKNEFVTGKNEKQYLQAYSELSRQTHSAPSKLSIISEINAAKEKENQINTDLRRKIVDLRNIKERIQTQSNAGYMQEAERIRDEEFLPMVEEVKANSIYQDNIDEIDPIIDGTRATDTPPIEPPKQDFNTFVGAVMNTEQVFRRIYKWKTEEGGLDDIPAMAQKIKESFEKGHLNKNQLKKWLDESIFDNKWKSLIGYVGRDLAYSIFQELSKD